MEPFLVRALAAAIGLGVVAAPLGCVVVWQRMAYFGETVAQASLLGVALALAFQLNMTASVLAVTLLVAGLILLMGRQRAVPLDSMLGLVHYGALAAGVIAAAAIKGPSVDLMGFLFGDIFAVTREDLFWIYGGGLAVVAVMAAIWQPLLRIAVHEDLAVAEGVNAQAVRITFIIVLALTIAIALKIVGMLLVIAFLIVPAVAARPMASTPERMAVFAVVIAVAGALAGLALSWNWDTPGGPSIVLVLALMAFVSVTVAALRRR